MDTLYINFYSWEYDFSIVEYMNVCSWDSDVKWIKKQREISVWDTVRP
jgi:hypothetical protein